MYGESNNPERGYAYRNSVNIRANLLIVSWQVYGNKITLNVSVLKVLHNTCIFS